MGVFYTAVSPLDWAVMMSGESDTVQVPKPESDDKAFWMMETLTGACAETDEIVAESSEYDYFAHVIRIEVSAESLEFFKLEKIPASGRMIWTILGKTWEKCCDGIKFIDFECEVGRDKQDERRKKWLLGDDRENLDWWLKLIREYPWSFEPVPCHDHCEVCMETLCAMPEHGGHSHAFRARGTEYHDRRMCGRCYAALLEISCELP